MNKIQYGIHLENKFHELRIKNSTRRILYSCADQTTTSAKHAMLFPTLSEQTVLNDINQALSNNYIEAFGKTQATLEQKRPAKKYRLTSDGKNLLKTLLLTKPSQ